MKVCLFLEGSYPYITGGVSAWVHDLIQGLPEVDFSLFTISASPNQTLRYVLPSNVREHIDVVLNQTVQSARNHPQLNQFVPVVAETHDTAFQDRPMDLVRLLKALPEGVSLHNDAMSHQKLWQMLTERNTQTNPLYPFSDYLWSWRGSHEMLFQVLAARPPEADLYHAVSTGFAGLAALAAKVRRSKPFLLTEHGLYHKERQMEIRKATFLSGYQRDQWIRLYDQISSACYREADLVTALFETNRQEQIRLGSPPDRTRVVPNGIDIPRFSAVARQHKPGFHIGLVGRVVPIKDIKTFIVTCKILGDSMPDARFYCIGPTDEDPDYYQECLRLVESLGLGDRLVFTDRQNVLEYYAFLNVLLLTSVREAQPLVILEAWSAGVLTVSTRVGNVPEMLDYDERFLAATKDAEALALKVRWLRENPQEAEQVLQGNQRKVRQIYDKTTLMDTYRTMYGFLGGRPWPESVLN